MNKTLCVARKKLRSIVLALSGINKLTVFTVLGDRSILPGVPNPLPVRKQTVLGCYCGSVYGIPMFKHY